MADSLPWMDTSSHSHSWDAVKISGLKDVEKTSEVWESGRQGVKAGLASVSFSCPPFLISIDEKMTTPDSPPLLLIIRPAASSVTRSYTKRSLAPRANDTRLANTCYKSNETCSDSTSCNGRGSCSLKKKVGDDECWGCKCASGYAGVECQKEDYSVYVPELPYLGEI
jgi:hypothetical protein